MQSACDMLYVNKPTGPLCVGHNVMQFPVVEIVHVLEQGLSKSWAVKLHIACASHIASNYAVHCTPTYSKQG